MAPISFKLPKDDESRPELQPTREEARQVRAALRKASSWHGELGGLAYAVACSGAFHALMVAILAVTLWGGEVETVQTVRASDGRIVETALAFEPQKTVAVTLPLKLAQMSPKPPAPTQPKALVEKEKPKAVAKKSTPKRKVTPTKRRRVAKRTPRQSRKLAGAPSVDGTEAAEAKELKLTENKRALAPPTAAAVAVEAPTQVADVSPPETVTPDPALDVAALMAGYRARVNGAFGRRFKYPRRAERAMLEGKVLVEVIIDAHGQILSRRILKSSGHAILDNAALASVASVVRLPAPPTELSWERKAIQVPFIYRSNRSAGARRGWGS